MTSRGSVERLDYLEWLGVDGLWLNPINPSPNKDWGYDVSDYRDVHPDLGDMATLERLVEEAGERGIRDPARHRPEPLERPAPVVRRLALVAGRALPRLVRLGGRQGRRAAEQLAERRSAGRHGRSKSATGQWYLHNFLPEQPDLNWWTNEVWEAFDDILRFWFDRGIAGFRIDVAHGIVNDKELRDDPPEPRGGRAAASRSTR